MRLLELIDLADMLGMIRPETKPLLQHDFLRSRSPMHLPLGEIRASLARWAMPPPIFCDPLRHLPFLACRGFKLDQLAEASGIRPRAPRFYRVSDWRQRRHVCGSSR